MYVITELFEEMHSHHTKSINALNRIIDVVDSILEMSEVPTDQFSIVTSFLISRFHKSLLSIRLLLTAGLEEDARTILRISLEQLLTLQYISKESKTRVKLFIEHNKVELMNCLDSIKRHYPNDYKKIDSNDKDIITKDYESVKENYSRYRGWSGKYVRQIAEDIGGNAIFWYDIIYNIESAHVHSTVKSSRNILSKDNGITNIKIGPYPFDATDLISKSIDLTKDMLMQAMNNWNLDTKEVSGIYCECFELLKQEFESK